MHSVLTAELYHNPAYSMTKARTLLALKTQHHKIVEIDKCKTSKHITSKYGTDEYKHLPIPERVASVAM